MAETASNKVVNHNKMYLKMNMRLFFFQNISTEAAATRFKGKR